MTGQASRVARGLRSITLNLQGMDDEGTQNLQLVAAMEKDFNKLGITLYDADGQLKSTFKISGKHSSIMELTISPSSVGSNLRETNFT